MKRDISITIKPTLSCNMHCKHCFNGMIEDREIISTKTTFKFLELVAKEYKNIGLTFHGGEPTLAGIEYYRDIFSFQKYLSDVYKVNFSTNFTTNGVMLTDELIELLKNNNVLINISFDGPHNHILRQKTEHVYSRLKEIQRCGAKLRVYCVETAFSYTSMFNTYEWFKKNNLDFKMVPVQPQGNAKNNLQIIMNPDQFVENWMKLYTYWLSDHNCKIKFLTFEEFLKLDRKTPFKSHWFYRKLALNPKGEISAFGRPNDINYCLGTPDSISNINECFEAETYIQLLSILDKHMEKFCPQCNSRDVCNGIAICSSFVYGDDYEMLKYGCHLANKIFQAVLEINETVWLDIENGNDWKYTKTVNKVFDTKIYDDR